MMKKMYKKILLVLILMISLSYFDVFADKCENYGNSDFKYEKVGTKKYKLTKLPNNNLRFYVNGDKNTIVGLGQPFDLDSEGYAYLSSTLKSQEWVEDCENKCTSGSSDCPSDCKKDPDDLNNSICSGDSYAVSLFLTISGSENQDIPAEEFSFEYGDLGTFQAYKKVDCEHPEGEFEEKFCIAKKNAKERDEYGKSHRVNFNGSSTIDAGTHTFKCKKDVYKKEEELQGENYYVNKDYIYGKETYYRSTNYYYHLSSSYTEKEKAKCEIVCEEGVDVEYGPPIASKAGLCFEYKVRVTSRVVCNTTEPEKPKSKYRVCSPTPVCTGIGVTSGKRYWSDKGGPNEDFYACMDSCEKGSYSNKCTKKCYNQVYGFSNKTNSSGLSYAEKLKSGVQEVTYQVPHNDTGDACPSDSRNCSNGCYSGEPGHSASWDGSGAARYYGCHCPGGYCPGSPSGICRNCKGCNDDCYWTRGSCREGDYMNYGAPKIDQEENKKAYLVLKAECESMAKCSTRTTEFAINVDYIDGSGTKKTVYFPYTESNPSDSHDFVKTVKGHGDGAGTGTFGNKNTTIINGKGDNKAHDKLLGCYLPDKDLPENIYRTPWSFPGSYINYKTSEISYKMDWGSSDTLWQEVKKKFCLPADAQDVNQKFWNNYFHRVAGTVSFVSTENLPDGCKDTYTSEYTLNDSDITYNIHASTKDFGYFGWDINIDCFYALNKTYPKITYNPTCPPVDPFSGVIARSIDLENVFPSTTGEEKGGASYTGRKPGFNWSDGAKNSKNPNYTADPTGLLTRIQEKGYSVYSDDNLDYYFELSKEELVKMKKEASLLDNNYTDFKDANFKKLTESNGLSRYVSTKIRNISGVKKIPSKESKALLCNNMIRYDSEECEY